MALATEYTHTVHMVFAFADSKNSFWYIVTPEQISHAELPTTRVTYSAKAGRKKSPGSIYDVKSRDADGTNIDLNTMRCVGQWGNDANRADWQTFQKSETLAKMGKNDEPVEEILEPLLRIYRRAATGQRAVLLHQVIRAFARS